MLRIRYYMCLIFSLSTLEVAAFISGKCRRFVGRVGMYGFLPSLTSYVSSTGDCSMIGKVENDKKVFIAVYHEKILDYIIVGHGDYISTYSLLSGCTKEINNHFIGSVREKYKKLNDLKSSSVPYDLYNRIEEVLVSDKILKQNCNHGVRG